MISARELTKVFTSKAKGKTTTHTAVDNLTFDVAPGSIIGFLGPNGAGKSTSLRMLTTLLKPDSGSARVVGCDIATDPVGVRRAIGYVSQSGSTGGTAHAGEEVVDHGRMYGLSLREATARAEALFEDLDLGGLWDRRPRTLSGGQRRRLDIAMGLVHRPQLIFLDEPTTGLDPQARQNLWDHIRGLRENHGVTVFITTHYLDEADALSDRLLIVDHGRLVADGSPRKLKRDIPGELVSLEVADSDDCAAATRILARHASSADDEVRVHRDVSSGATVLGVRVSDASRQLPELLRQLADAGVAADGLEVQRPTLDDVFLNLTGYSLREGQ
ncbi:ATP-binding cassette domain-containing protein [Corynebacterium sp. TAE3-ERU12]|nr:ATP-binding cassette domain-containing protein [Corynebacterium sp. TAE3-ERU12]